jgi:VIT1/CCC1 family predicted Fe2+/Mn2+ transporter
VGAALPVLPFLLVPPGPTLAAATALSVGGLFAAGAAKGKVSGLSWMRSGLEMALLGSLAAAVTFGVGKLFDVAAA